MLELLRWKTGRRPFDERSGRSIVSPSTEASHCSSCIHLPFSSVLDPKMWIAGKLGLSNLLNFLFPMIRSRRQMEMKSLSRLSLLGPLWGSHFGDYEVGCHFRDLRSLRQMEVE